MPTFGWILIAVAAAALVSGLVVMLVITLPIAKAVMDNQLVKENAEKWGRECSDTTNEEQVLMWEAGKQWAAERKDRMTELSMEHDGLKLYGEYYEKYFRK